MDCQRICEVAVSCGNISFDGMCHGIHTCMGNKLLRHCFSKVWVYDSNIWSDLEVCQRILDSLLVVCDDSESCNLSSCTGS